MTNITTNQFLHPSPNTVIESASSRHTPSDKNKEGNRRPEIYGKLPNNYKIFLKIDSKEKAIEFMYLNSSKTYTLEVPISVGNYIGESFKYQIKDERITIIKPTLDKNDLERNAQLLGLIPEKLSGEVAQITFCGTKILFNDMHGNWLMALTRDHAQDITNYIEQNMKTWKQKYPGVETLTIAVMGCVVNGPGESKQADIGISLPGSSEAPSIPVYQDGDLLTVLKGDDIKDQFITILNTYIEKRYSLVKTPS